MHDLVVYNFMYTVNSTNLCICCPTITVLSLHSFFLHYHISTYEMHEHTICTSFSMDILPYVTIHLLKINWRLFRKKKNLCTKYMLSYIRFLFFILKTQTSFETDKPSIVLSFVSEAKSVLSSNNKLSSVPLRDLLISFTHTDKTDTEHSKVI